MFSRHLLREVELPEQRNNRSGDGGISVAETLTARQRQTLNARSALAARFPNDEAKSEHYRQLANKANAGRVVLSGDETQTLTAGLDTLTIGLDSLAAAYALLQSIAAKAERKAAQSHNDQPDESAA
jgi:hypothetical protein